jgi:hypothetical protein
MPEPFIDLSNFNPLGTDVQSEFVEQGLLIGRIPPEVKDNGYVHYASLPFNGASSPRDNSAMIFELQSGEVETPVVKN